MSGALAGTSGRIGMLRHLSTAQWSELAPISKGVRTVAAREIVTEKGMRVDESLLLLDGMMGRYVPRPLGARPLIVALQVPGDFVDLHGFPLGMLDHQVRTITSVRLGVFDHAALRDLVERDKSMWRALWSLTMIDASIHRHWAFRMGGLRSMVRVANFLCEMQRRIGLVDAEKTSDFALPLTQIDIADACGMTAVHVSRVARDLREDGCCTLLRGRVTIHDSDRLRRIGAFDDTYLYLPR